jgi:hypothetical protein
MIQVANKAAGALLEGTHDDQAVVSFFDWDDVLFST